MSEWKEYQLSDVTSRIGDGLHGTPNYSETGDYFFINGNNLMNGKILIKEDTKRIDYNEFLKYSKPLSENTILLSINGTIGNVALYNDEKCMLGKSACYINVNEKVERIFLYYTFLNKDFQNYIEGVATGTTIPNVPLKGIREFTFKAPQIKEQKVIGEILSSLDDKINLLHRQNSILRQIAETLFRKCFIEDANESWEETTLYNVIELVGGGTPKTEIAKYWDGNIKWISAKDITPNHKGFILTTEKLITEEGLKNSSARLLPKFSTIISARGTVGKYCLLSEPMAFSQSNYGVKPKFNDCFFFTYLLIANCVEELQAAAYGTVFDTITTNTFKEHKITLPTEAIIHEFESVVRPNFEKIFSNNKQIQILTQLRDALLPKLMSGEVKVKN